MDTLQIAAGDIVRGLDQTELVEIREVRPFGQRFLVVGITVESGREIRRPVTQEELHQFQKVRGASFTFQGLPETFLLAAEAHRIRIAHQFDPLFAVNSSIVDPLPHQVEAVYRYLLPLPRIRFLLADDTGAGKTIMAGLLLKELLFRHGRMKILIVTPGGLTKQWAEEELQEKFGLHARLVNRHSFEADPGQFARYDDGLFVTSIDFLARNESCLNEAGETQWDFIVVDEAHKLSAYEYGRKLDESGRYKAIKLLANRTDHLLFLTATPHRGRKDTFRRLLLLLDRDLFQKDKHVMERVRAQSGGEEDFEGEQPISRARNRFFLRRLKEEMVDWDNSELFKRRFAETVGYDLTPEEKELYDRVTRYVRSQRKQAKEKKNRNVELTLMVMQRRLASSIYAITRTLEKRRTALNEVLEILNDPNRPQIVKKRLLAAGAQPDDPRGIAEYEELTEADRQLIDDRIFRQVLTNNPEQVEKERDEVQNLLNLARELSRHQEAKFRELLKVLDSSDVIRDEEEKLVIFTEHRDTLVSLTERLEDRGYTVANIHGQMDVDTRKQQQRDFQRRAKIMVATDAAGEGINLQFCRYLINWDIPWNPNRLEQRMGRIHRYGQAHDVHVYNLVAQNTREGSVIKTVLEKLDVMREQMGTDRVYDVIDDLLEDVPLVELIQRAIDTENGDEATIEAQRKVQTASQQRAEDLIALQKKSSLASKLDLRAARELRDASDERRLQPLFIQRFFERAWRALSGSIREDGNYPVYYLGSVPSELRELSGELRKSLPEKYETPFVFDKSLLSIASKQPVPERTKLMGPGHPLFEAIIHWAIKEGREAFAQGTILIDPNIAKPMRLWLVKSTIEDGRVSVTQPLAHEQLNAVVADHMGTRKVSPAYLLTCVAPTESSEMPDLPEISRDEIQAWAYDEVTEKQLAQVRKDRKNEVELRREYLTTAFTELIMELQEDLNALQRNMLFGDENETEREAVQKRIDDLKQRKVERLAELDEMMVLTANLPEVLTQATVIPDPVATLETDPDSPGKGVAMRRDDEVEAIAMKVVMAYERSRGWIPYDVHNDGEHYDIRSESSGGEKRYIEAKGRAQSGPVMLTGPELDKLEQLGQRAWLYIVTFCKGQKPKLQLIQDPIPKLHPVAQYRQVQYLVDESDWQAQAETTDFDATEVQS